MNDPVVEDPPAPRIKVAAPRAGCGAPVHCASSPRDPSCCTERPGGVSPDLCVEIAVSMVLARFYELALPILPPDTR